MRNTGVAFSASGRDVLHAGRVRLTFATVIITLLCLAGAFFTTNGQHFLSPGPLISAHSTIEDCGALPHEERPADFEAVVREWWEGREATGGTAAATAQAGGEEASSAAANPATIPDSAR